MWSLGPTKPQRVDMYPLIDYMTIIFSSQLIWVDWSKWNVKILPVSSGYKLPLVNPKTVSHLTFTSTPLSCPSKTCPSIINLSNTLEWRRKKRGNIYSNHKKETIESNSEMIKFIYTCYDLQLQFSIFFIAEFLSPSQRRYQRLLNKAIYVLQTYFRIGL